MPSYGSECPAVNCLKTGFKILGFIHRPAKFQKLGLAPSNSLKFLTRLRRVNAGFLLNLFPKWLNLVRKMTFYEFVKFGFLTSCADFLC